MWSYLFILLPLLVFVESKNEWDANCPNYCHCKWVSGKKSIECTNASITEIPRNLSSEVQSLDLSKNQLTRLPKNSFQDVKLVNIHKLYLRSCGLKDIHENAFDGLKILIELDLSENHVQKLNPRTFLGMDRLRVLLFNNNKLVTLETGLLSNLKFLQRVDFSHNNLTSVSRNAFTKDPKLQYVLLHDNNLSYMDPIDLEPEQKLSSLVLHNNPWNCDCKLQSFRNWTIEKNLYTPPTDCQEPERLRKSLWNEIKPEQFACKPNISEPHVGTIITMTTDSEETISCKVYGDPVPAVTWYLNGHNIVLKKNENTFKTTEKKMGTTIWVNLTIRNPRPQDKGELICAATNPGGNVERNLTLIVKYGGLIDGLDANSGSIWLWLILCIILTLLFITACLVLLCYCFWKRKKMPFKHHDMNTSNGSATIDDPDMQKSLITAVNPVEKPPRRQEAPPSVASCGTEMSEINRTLLDNDSVFGPANENDEETQSLNYSDPKPKIIKDRHHSDFHRSERPYPPDLLSFPPRSSQISPASSCTSALPDHSRPLPLNLQSPIHSPLYNPLSNSNVFRTLPHSRSQSPFTSPGYPAVQSRQGYVTIPRRPRVPSWSAPSSTTGSEIVEPVYDNLGLRTTVDGSSILSLNKIMEASPIGIRNRPLPTTPITPIYQKNGLPSHYAPIEEHESPPAPCPTHQTPHATTLPKLPMSPYSPSENGTRDNQISQGSRDNTNMGFLTPTEIKTGNQMSPTVSTNSISGRSPKVPPKPPPKPKNKSVNSTLFEDEGEDGTEV